MLFQRRLWYKSNSADTFSPLEPLDLNLKTVVLTSSGQLVSRAWVCTGGRCLDAELSMYRMCCQVQGSELQCRGARCVSRWPPREGGLGSQVAFDVQWKLLMGRWVKAESRINPEKPLPQQGRWFQMCPWFAADSSKTENCPLSFCSEEAALRTKSPREET